MTNKDGLVFVAERMDTVGAWQLPQGGIDEGENAREAALRELEEEIGVGADLVVVESEHPEWLTYDLPHELIGKVWKGRWRGQKQRWFLLRFLGSDADVTLDVPHPEFRQWRWASPEDVVEGIVPFKRDIYKDVFSYFGPNLGSSASGN